MSINKNMVKIIVVCHGTLATAFEKTLKLIAGDFAHFKFIDFYEGLTSDDLKKLITLAITPKQPTLIITDLKGGTPFKMAAELIITQQISAEYTKFIAGVNLPMLLSISFETSLSLNEITSLALASGKNAIVPF